MPNPCAAVLVPNFNFKTQENHEKVALLLLITKENFDQAKKAVDNSGSVEFTDLFKIGNAATRYEDFSQTEAYLKQQNINIEESKAVSIVQM